MQTAKERRLVRKLANLDAIKKSDSLDKDNDEENPADFNQQADSEKI